MDKILVKCNSCGLLNYFNNSKCKYCSSIIVSKEPVKLNKGSDLKQGGLEVQQLKHTPRNTNIAKRN